MALIANGRVMVTGASRGIGRAVAEALLERGARLAAVARDREALASLARTAPDRVQVLVADLADSASRDRLMGQAAAALGGLDGLVQCAGVVRHASVGGITAADLEAMMAVNLEAPVLLGQQAAQLMRSQGSGGSIVNVASTLAMAPAPGTTGYAASKAALVAATRAMALELAPDGIRVNAVAPGLVDTDMIAGRPKERLAAMHPLGRLGTPADVAQAVLHLLDAPWTTGTVYVVDGGLTAGSQ